MSLNCRVCKQNKVIKFNFNDILFVKNNKDWENY